jgi:chromosome partitioning protein
MRVITLASLKGGPGKSTLASALAVRSARESKRVALLDVDPQESLSRWWQFRGSPKNPKLFEGLDSTAEAIELLLSEGWDWVFIDTPPALLQRIEPAIAVSDFVLIPCRPSAFDLDTADAAADLCQEHGKPFAFVLNHIQHGQKMADSAALHLSQYGPVLKERIAYRKSYLTAIVQGKSGPEIDKDGKAAEEIEALWNAVKALTTPKRKARAHA